MIVHVLITLFYLGILSWVIFKLPFFHHPRIPRKVWVGVFLLKFIFGLFLWGIYTYHYTLRGTSDAFNYYDDAKVIHKALKEDPSAYFRILSGVGDEHPSTEPYLERTGHWYKPYNYGVVNDNRTIIRLNLICLLFSFGYYHVHTAIFCFISFLGLLALFKTFDREIPGKSWSAFLASFLVPSVLFWGSGVLKEGFLLFSMGFFLWYWLLAVRDRNWKALLAALLFSLFLVSIKSYIFLALLPGLLSFIWIEWFKVRQKVAAFIGTHLLVIGAGLNLPAMGVHYDIIGMLRLKRKDFYNLAELKDAGSVVEIPAFQDVWDVLAALPQAWFNALYRPHLLEMEGMIYVPPAIENLALMTLPLGMILWWRRPTLSERSLLLWCISFVLILGGLIGLVTPVLGAVVRYQVPILPFYVFLVFALMDLKRIKRRIPWLSSRSHS